MNLEINRGEFIALAGRNGSGKTTLVKHFNGLLKPTRGTVTINGKDAKSVASERLARVVGYVFQNPDHMLFSNTIEEEVRFGPKNLKLQSDEIKRRVDLALEVTGLTQFRGESPLFFGKGVRRMITIAAILSMEPEVMAIDEPTLGMDVKGRISVMSLIEKLNRLGKTIIVITHDMKLVADYCKRTLVLSKGELLFDGPTERLFSNSVREIISQAGLKSPQRLQLASLLNWDGGIPTLAQVEDMVTSTLSRYKKTKIDPKPGQNYDQA